MERILLVARNVFRAVLHGKIIYLWLAALALMFLQAAPALFMNFGGDAAIQNLMRKRAVSSGLGTWSTMCIALAIFVSASAIGGEITKKTIVNVFARPIQRWEFLVGKWVGIQAFALLSLAFGLLVSFGLSQYLGAAFEMKVLGLAVAHTAAAVFLYSGLGIAFNTLLSPGLSGAFTIIIAFLPGLVTVLVGLEEPTPHAIGVAMDYVVPPGYTSYYAEALPAQIPPGYFGRGGRGNRGGRGGGPEGNIPPVPVPPPAAPAAANPEPDIDYSAQTKILLQNVGYAAVFFALGCLIFLRRDLRLT
jgi:ABC-type transport system involved in multi-copper enzyme maturation permease subunit